MFKNLFDVREKINNSLLLSGAKYKAKYGSSLEILTPTQQL